MQHALERYERKYKIYSEKTKINDDSGDKVEGY
jgi:hypothetical protein